MEKQKASKRFRAAGSLAKVCLKLYDNVTSTAGDDDQESLQEIEGNEKEDIVLEINPV